MEAAFHALCAENAQEAARLCKRWLESGGATDAPSSVRSITVLRRVARELGEKTREGARLLEAVAHVLEGHGRYEESLKLLTALSASGPPQEVALKRRLGSLAWRVGKTRLALRHLGACVGAEVEAADPVEAVHARSELALLRHFRGDTDEALEHAAHGIALWKKLRAAKRESTLSSVVKLHGILGQVCIRRLQFNEAIDALQAGLKVASGKTAPANVCLLLNNLALAQHLGGDLSAALETFSLAEGQARELADPAALASVRANVAQLHAKQGQFHLARDLLDTLENAPAVRQSSRLRLGSLYSQGLYLNLLRGEADSVWTEVEDLAATVGDAFLGRFAGLQRAEGYIFSGRYAAARGILEAAIPKEGRRKGKQELLESLHDSLVHSRLATVAALCGDRETSRSARDRVASTMSDGREVPAMLHSWSLVYGGIAAVETGDWIEAHSMLTEALDTFVRTGFLAGQVECHLALADGLLRQSTGDPNHPDEHVLTKVKESIRHAKEAPFEAPTGVSPRDRDLRVALLDARYALHDLLRRIDGNGPLEQTEEVQQSLADSLVRVAGDPALTHTAEYTLQLELLLSVSATLRGDRQAARDAEARARAAQRQLARSLCASARKAFGKRDPWQRYGLTAFRPGSGAQRLGRASTEALEHVLSAVARGPAGSFNSLLGLLAARLGVELRMWGETLEQPLTGGELPKGTARCTLVTFISTQGRLTGGLRASRDATLPFTAEEEVLINLAGKALAPWVTRGAATTPARPDAERSTEELSAHRKREKPRGSARTETRKVGVSSRFVQRVLEEEGIVAAGREMQRVITLARKLAMADLPILITGESGTGKDVVARLIHLLSPRADAPFLSQSASAVPEELFEADLFGYEQGAFTGAEQTRTGFLFRASGGTFHLEEIGDLAPGMQQRFLRVLEENVVRPLGATSARQLDVHFIASTHQDIEAMLEAGSFRRDLFFRLSGARISLPPLRRRLDEIPALAEHYWAEFAKSRSRFPTSTREALCSHTWPGNVRELITVLRRLSLEVSGVPSAGDVRAVLGEATTQGPFCPGLFESSSYAELKQSLEESYLEHLWTKHAGDLERIATDLGTTSRSVYRRFERLGLKPKDLAQRGRK
jgi:DNA-binding NtrC family response regulator/tetratricopeptide (TPR) repeat protein